MHAPRAEGGIPFPRKTKDFAPVSDPVLKCKSEVTDFGHNFSDPVGAQIFILLIVQPHDAFATLYHTMDTMCHLCSWPLFGGGFWGQYEKFSKSDQTPPDQIDPRNIIFNDRGMTSMTVE